MKSPFSLCDGQEAIRRFYWLRGGLNPQIGPQPKVRSIAAENAPVRRVFRKHLNLQYFSSELHGLPDLRDPRRISTYNRH